MTRYKEEPEFLVVDLFAGAGGVSTGISRAEVFGKKVAKVIAAVNHDEQAIESHELNHPETFHFIEDVRDLDFSHLHEIVKRYQKLYPKAKLALWASMECTNFSNAKGGPKDEGSRSLATIIPEYLDWLKPDYFLFENVKEFLDWGPCSDTGYQISEFKGEYYNKWAKGIEDRGYFQNTEISNAADHGARTSRVRLFGAFTRVGEPFAFPQETHSRKQVEGKLPWQPVRDVLDLRNHGKSIFSRRFSDNTYRRIYAGCEKRLGEDYLIQYNGQSTCRSIDEPCGTLTTKDRFSKVQLQFMDQQYGNGSSKSLNEPNGSLTTVPKQSLVTAHFLDNPQWRGNTWSIDRPCFTLIARMDKAPPAMITTHKGKGCIEYSFQDGKYERKLKIFMNRHGIKDITKRMLEVPEMLDIMGFGRDYQLAGTKTNQKKFIGNAVACIYPQRWLETLATLKIEYETTSGKR